MSISFNDANVFNLVKFMIKNITYKGGKAVRSAPKDSAENGLNWKKELLKVERSRETKQKIRAGY